MGSPVDGVYFIRLAGNILQFGQGSILIKRAMPGQGIYQGLWMGQILLIVVIKNVLLALCVQNNSIFCSTGGLYELDNSPVVIPGLTGI